MRSIDNHLGFVLQEPPVAKINFETTHLKFLSDLPGANKFILKLCLSNVACGWTFQIHPFTLCCGCRLEVKNKDAQYTTLYVTRSSHVWQLWLSALTVITYCLVLMYTCLLYIYKDIMALKCFLRYWPFVRGIHQWPLASLHKGSVIQDFDIVALMLA